MAFEDLLLPDAEVLTNEYIPYTVGSSLLYELALIDDNDSLFSFAAGFTAALTLNTRAGVNVAGFTQTLTDGRRIDLSLVDGRNVAIRSTPAGLSMLAGYVYRPLAFNLVLTRTSDGLAVDVMRDCFVIPYPAHD